MMSPQTQNESVTDDHFEGIDRAARHAAQLADEIEARRARIARSEQDTKMGQPEGPLFMGPADDARVERDFLGGAEEAAGYTFNKIGDRTPESWDASARGLLSQGIREISARAQHYDAPGGERSMAATVAAFNAIHGLGMTEVQGWQFMELLKIVRSSQGKFKPDNFVDGAAYAALAGEAAARG